MLRILMLIVCLGFAWPSHAGSVAPVSEAAGFQSDHQLADNEGLVLQVLSKQVFSKHLAHPASFAQSKAELNALLQFDQTDLTDAIQVGSQSPSSNNEHSNHDRSLDLAIAASSRFSSLLRHDPEDVEPAYQLAIELPVAPVPSFAKDYRVDMQPTLDWTLKTSPPSGRVSGWKESNLIYTVYHHRLPLA
ncbi:hypothetical protein [Photobacterium rosenbergii]|uniref:DUF2066 domain-containing protein n=1 Tax=Photobacterium rosenbergii TaxID=294936 RepID=A0ABU3ZCY8_9GAMM|nr:hypothetical protein [Photobacterium rosenbergii]MDV5167990.1 hypothetical protein [Photobacterium rosenbergii]